MSAADERRESGRWPHLTEARDLAARLGRKYAAGHVLLEAEELEAAGIARYLSAPAHRVGGGATSTSWVYRYVRAGIVDHVRKVDALRRRGRSEKARYDAAAERLWQAHGREPTADDVATLCRVPVGRVALLWERAGLRRPDSLDAVRDRDRERDGRARGTLTDYLAAEQAGADAAAEQRSAQAQLDRALRRLDVRAADIVLRTVLGGRTLREAGAAHGITQARASQIRRAALDALRGYLLNDEHTNRERR